MKETLQDLLTTEGHWLLPVFLIVLATAASAALLRRGLTLLGERLARTHTPWDDAALAAADKPLLALAWVLGLNAAASFVATRTDAGVLAYASPLRELLLIVILAWFLLRFVNAGEERLLHPAGVHHPIDLTTTRAVAKVLRISILITATLILLQKLGYSVSGVLAFGGIGGIAVGFAAKDLLANFFGGLMIFLDRPFSIGDWIRSPDRELEGTVEYIGWRLTRIQTAELRPLYVPNSTFASIAVENVSRMTHRRLNHAIRLRLEDWRRLPRLVERLRGMLATHPDLDPEQAQMASFTEFGESALEIKLHAFTRTTDWAAFQHIREDVFLRALALIAEEGAEVAVPTRTVHVESALPPEQRAAAPRHPPAPH
ncbi:MAG: mechanosensitive ion channel family protein [Pseudomonadota bacterium]